MRSASEILFRLRQEATNAAMFVSSPSLTSIPGDVPYPPGRAVAAALFDSDYAREMQRLAGEIRAHRFPLLGLTLDTGPRIEWRRDYVNAKQTGTDYFRLIPYLDAERTGDHKIIWELNRHQHLVLLAQSYLLHGDESNLAEIFNQFESWEEANPFQRGINWCSALEVAFRALSMIWVYHLIGDEMRPGIKSRFIESLFRHGRHIENNLSFYFSPNTHLLGEAVALHSLGSMFSEFRDLGAQVVGDQMDKQVRDDGSHFEQSTYYHVYALDMFLFHALHAEVSTNYRAKLERMADYLHALLGPSGELPFLGDDDGGRFFHPYGTRSRFGRATMATCSVFMNRPEWLRNTEDLHEQAIWWLGRDVLSAPAAPPTYSSRFFANTGIAIMMAGDRQIIIDAGPFGPWGSGHSHSDTLSLVIPGILIDPGTYTYVGDPVLRNWFRGSGAHNTIRIDGGDQAVAENPFRWSGQPTVRVLRAEEHFLDAECSYRGFTHRRQVRYIQPETVLITDEITGPSGIHNVEQFWHLDSPDAARHLTFDGEPDRVEGWRSDAFGQKRSSTILRIQRQSELPLKLETKILLE